MSKQKGFTLIELLVVVSIIGLLSTIAIVSFRNAQAKARNAKRMGDLRSIQSALEAYSASNGGYPLPAIGANVWADLASTSKLGNYMPGGMPLDPMQSGANYYTYCADGSSGATVANRYLLTAMLENQGNSTEMNNLLISDIDGNVTNYAPGECALSTGVNNTSGSPGVGACQDAFNYYFCLGNPTGNP